MPRATVRPMSPVVVIVVVLFTLFSVLVSRRQRFSALETAAVTVGNLVVLALACSVAPNASGDGIKIFLAAMGGAATQWGYDAYRARTGEARTRAG